MTTTLSVPQFPVASDVAQPIDAYFLMYQYMLKPTSPSDTVPNKATADLALDFLQYQYDQTASNILFQFDQIWLNGKQPIGPLSFRNIAFYYKPEIAHHVKAINFLKDNMGANTHQKFHQIWFGEKWNRPDEPFPPSSSPSFETPGSPAAPLDQYFLRYQEILKPTSPSHTGVPSKTKADKALDFLQKQYEETASSVLARFDEIWLNGRTATMPLSFRNVAYYYDPNISHHRQAVDYLKNNLNPRTHQWLADIWTGKRQ
jgi:hypothetical protein